MTNELIFHSAHFLGLDPKDFVAEAVRSYLDQRREEVRHGMVESMRLLDGALGASVTMVAGQPPAQVENQAQGTTRSGLPERTPGAAAEALQSEHEFQEAQAAQPEHHIHNAQMQMAQPEPSFHEAQAVPAEHHVQQAQVAYPDHIVPDAQFHQA